jgi:hypothetical protein
MDLGIFDRFFPSLKNRALIDERSLDMSRSDKNSENMLYLCIERMFELTNGCRILERICYRLAHMILTCSIGEARDHLKERED